MSQKGLGQTWDKLGQHCRSLIVREDYTLNQSSLSRLCQSDLEKILEQDAAVAGFVGMFPPGWIL